MGLLGAAEKNPQRKCNPGGGLGGGWMLEWGWTKEVLRKNDGNDPAVFGATRELGKLWGRKI